MAAFDLYLNMVGCCWHVSAPYAVKVDDNYLPFVCDPREPDCEYEFTIGRPELPTPSIEQDRMRVWQMPDGIYIERPTVLSNHACICICVRNDDPLHMQGWIYPDRTGAVVSLNNLFDGGSIETMISAIGAINLHSSFIRWQGGAILFTAPSGTGKSTQAGLWEQYTDAEQINGDRSVIRCVDDVWTAFGFPFAGSSGIFRNKAVPIRAIVVLRQAPENTITRLRPGEAFRLLYSESAIQRWHETAHTVSVDRLVQLSRTVPVYMLCCTPDERAVRLLQDTLSMEELQ